MALSTKSYLNLSALAYIDFDDSAKGKDIKHLVDDRMILITPDSPPSKMPLILFALTN